MWKFTFPGVKALCRGEFPVIGGCTDNMLSGSCFTTLLYP